MAIADGVGTIAGQCIQITGSVVGLAQQSVEIVVIEADGLVSGVSLPVPVLSLIFS